MEVEAPFCKEDGVLKRGFQEDRRVKRELSLSNLRWPRVEPIEERQRKESFEMREESGV